MLPHKYLAFPTINEMVLGGSECNLFQFLLSGRNLLLWLILELQARCGLRIGEVLNLRASDVSGRKLIIQEPKPGRDAEVAFMPEHIAARLVEYITTKQVPLDDRVFPLCYTKMRNLVAGLGKKLNVNSCAFVKLWTLRVHPVILSGNISRRKSL
jgi:integrase